MTTSAPGPGDQSETQSCGVEFLFDHTTHCTVEGSIEDGDPIVARVDDTLESPFGYTNSELRGEDLTDFVSPEGQRAEVDAIDREIREGDIGPRAAIRKTADGPRDCLRRATGGDGDRSSAIYTDIAAQKEREPELRRQNERMDQFVSVVASARSGDHR